MDEFPVATSPAPGVMGVDWENRVDFERLRRHRLARVRQMLDEFELGAVLLFETSNIRYATSTQIGYWAFNKGERWALVSDRLDTPDNKHLYSLAVDDAGVLVLVGEAGSVFRSDDGGRQWAAVDIGYGGSLLGVLATGADRFSAFGLRGRLFLTEDAGASWREADGPARATLTGGE